MSGALGAVVVEPDAIFHAGGTPRSDALDASLHPYYRAIVDAYAAAGRPSFHQLSATAARDLLRTSMAAAPAQTNLPALAMVTDEVVSGPAGPVPIRRYTPEGQVKGICVFMHAGGWTIGDLGLSDALCRRLAAEAGCEVVSVDYRLAPEHPHPQPLNDAYAVLEWAAAQASGPIVIAGESAGGNLAAACAIKARDDGGLALAGQFLAYPVTDHDFATTSYLEVGGRNWLLSTADMKWFWDNYCPDAHDRDNPLVSPMQLKDPARLPPALVYVAELDPLRDEGIAYAGKLAKAGVPVESRREAGMLHGYLSAAGAVPAAADAVREAGGWIRKRIAEAAT